MVSWFRHLDELLRGRRTTPQLLADGTIDVPLRIFSPLAIILGATYGFFMGWYAWTHRAHTEALHQVLASVVKLPALFLLTLIVTFPSLYVFNALVGCRLRFAATLRLLVGAIVINLAVAASLGPILGFFTVSTESYAFMVLLNVALLAVGGVVGLGFLLQTLRRIAEAELWEWRTSAPPAPPVTSTPTESDPAESTPLGDPAGAPTVIAAAPPTTAPRSEGLSAAPPPARPRVPGPLERPPGGYSPHAIGSARGIFQIWMIIYALVGAQMGWLLRPFIGSPDMPFTWFRPKSGNFFQAVINLLENLVSGKGH